MADKIVISKEVLHEIANKLNSKELTIGEAEQKYGYSKKAIQRRLKEEGYSYSREKAAYEFTGSPEGTTKPQDSIKEEISNTTLEENIDTVKANNRPLGILDSIGYNKDEYTEWDKKFEEAREKLKESQRRQGRPAKYKKDPNGKNLDKTKLTLEIDNTVYKALQLKKAKEGLVINKFVEDLLRENIEKEYFEFAEK